MPVYKCPKCGRTVEKPYGIYYCSVCGPSALMKVSVPKPSEVFPPSEKHKCFAGEHYFSPHSAKVCPECGWLICPVCGKCACKLSPEARQAVEAVWETYCVFCRFRPHERYRPEV
jgi:DNA-directed RNA polymerase subunit RPC12/RpoP